MSDRVSVSVEGHLAIVSLFYPDRLNVLDRQGWEAIAATMTSLAQDPLLHCVVIEGSGEQAFSAGSDIGKFPEERQTPEQVQEYGQVLESALTALHDCPIPTVAEIRGVCVGGGLEIAATCDLRICGESSRFGAPINQLGLTMSYTELSPLVQLIGASGTLEILLEGGLLDAKAAYQKGLVSRVVPDDKVGDEARATALRIASGAPLVNRWHKKFVRRLAEGGGPLTEAEQQEAYEAFGTDDYLEGVLAFLERRDPRFKGQ
jgi:enoyl-CoA hydratase/carnithine racemase